MSPDTPAVWRFSAGKWPGRFFTLGAALLGVSLLAGLAAPAAFFHAYLWSFLLFLGVALGSLGLILLHALTGGAWGFALRRVWEASAVTLPLLALLFLPIAFGMQHLFSWTAPAAFADPKLAHKGHFFFSVPYFLARAVFYFALWGWLAWRVRRLSLSGNDTALQRLAGPGLLLIVVSMSLAAVDWIMALEPRFYSTTFGLLVIVGQSVSAMAWSVAVAARLARQHPERESAASGGVFHDVGGMLLALVLLWAYLAFMQYLIIWNGNLPDEALWYVHRGHGGWQWVALGVIVLHFALPFLLLIFGGVKRRVKTLGGVATVIFVAHLLDVFWMVAPSWRGARFSLTGLDLLVPLGLGGVWLGVFFRQLAAAPLLPLQDSRLPQAFRRDPSDISHLSVGGKP